MVVDPTLLLPGTLTPPVNSEATYLFLSYMFPMTSTYILVTFVPSAVAVAFLLGAVGNFLSVTASVMIIPSVRVNANRMESMNLFEHKHTHLHKTKTVHVDVGK